MEPVVCQYRRVEQGRSICGVAQIRTERNIDTVDHSVCSVCPVPKLVKQHPCKNLSIGTQIMAQQGHPVLVSYAVDCGWKLFSKSSEVEDCDARCPKWLPLQLTHDINQVEQVFNTRGQKLTDTVLRGAVLIVLYRYHCEHPERYGMFDVTPEYLEKALGTDRATLARVVLPMADSDLIKLRWELGDTLFAAATITCKGIEQIDREPLLGQLNTASVRLMGDRSADDAARSPFDGADMAVLAKLEPVKRSAVSVGPKALFRNALQEEVEVKVGDSGQ